MRVCTVGKKFPAILQGDTQCTYCTVDDYAILLTKSVQSRWLDIGQVIYLSFYGQRQS